MEPAHPSGRVPLVIAAVTGAVLYLVLREVGVSILDAVWLTVLLAVLPIFSIAQVRLVAEMDIERSAVYRSSAMTLVLLGGVSWWIGRRGGIGVGLVPMRFSHWVGWSLLLTGLALLIVLLLRFIAQRMGARESPLLRALLPRTPRERWAFFGLSLAAGLGEELAYRGFAISTLGALVGGPWAVVVTSLVFGVLHVYQGRLGTLRAGLLGAVMAWGFLATGSLWPPIAAHALWDVASGLVLGERLMVPDAEPGVDGMSAERSGDAA